MNYKQLLILRLSNLTKWKNDEEMIIPEEMREDFDWPNTCEFLGDGRYILRMYYECGQLHRKTEYQNDQQHGLSLGWYENGQPAWKVEHQNDQQHGLSLGWYKDGQPEWKYEYQNGRLIAEYL